MEQVRCEYGGVLPPDAVIASEPNIAYVAAHKKGSRTATKARPNSTKLGQSAIRSPGRRFPVLNAFVDVTMRRLTGSEVAVWLILFRDTKADTGTSRTGQQDIARRAGVNARTVR